MKLAALVSGVLFLAACSDSDPAPELDAGGGSSADAGQTAAADAGSADSGIAPDTGVVDGGSVPDAGAPDSGVSGVVDACNPLTQTDCIAPESQCIAEAPVGDGARCVVPPDDPIGFGDSCDARAGECEPGLVCVNSGAGPICRQICDRADGSGCAARGDDWDCRETLRNTNWGVCGELPPECSVFTNAPCNADQACGPLRRRDGRFELRCIEAGPGTHGDSCGTSATRCAAGFVCVRIGSTGRTECRQVCQDDAECPTAMASECSGTVTGLPVTYCHP